MIHTKFMLCCLLSVLLLSCSEDDDIVRHSEKNAIFVYMAADNDLDYFAIQNINQMERGFSENQISNGVYVYVDRVKNRKTSHPCLYKVKADNTDLIVSEIIKTYPEQNSSSADVFVSALKDAIAFSRKANEQIKGIVLWSHGSAWLPKSEILNSKRASTSSTRSFGIDITTEESQEPYEMDIRELAERLRPFHYDFLVFDACFMSSIEVLYEMRNSFDYIVSSPTEVLATGFPYKEILPELLSNSPNYSEIVEKYIAQYNEKKGVLKSASMTVVKTSVLKSFSESLKELINHDVTVPDISTILQYDQEATSWLFDIGGFVSLFKNSERKELVVKLLSDMILSYNHTDMFYGKIPLNGSSGISIYIPNNHKDRKYEHEFYKTLSWYKDVSCDSYFWNNYNTGILQ